MAVLFKEMKTIKGNHKYKMGSFTEERVPAPQYFKWYIAYPSTPMVNFIKELEKDYTFPQEQEVTIAFTCGNSLVIRRTNTNYQYHFVDNKGRSLRSFMVNSELEGPDDYGIDVYRHDESNFIMWHFGYSKNKKPVEITEPIYLYRFSNPDGYSVSDIRYNSNQDIINNFINTMDDGVIDDPGGNSGEGGGSGTFDNTSDPVDFPSLPTLSAVSAGFVSLYAPTLTQMNNLSSYMWSDAFDINNFKKLFADPMDVVIGLSIVPVSVPKGTDKEIKIGLVSTGVTMTQAASQYVTVDCGTIDVKEYWGSALDYSPYTKFSIYLPYIGTRDIKTDDIMGKTMRVKYNIDILSGSCTAMIKCGESVLYEYSGSCASSIPLTGNNWTSLVTAGIQLAGMGIAAAATGGAAAAAAAPTAATLGKAAGSAATYAAGNVSSMKPTVQRSGGVSGSAGMLGIQRPYLIAELPRQSLARNYKSFVGYPSNITKKLSELSGYTEIEDVHLQDIPATTSELEEIHNLLVNGVIM